MPTAEELGLLVQAALRRAGHTKLDGSGEVSYYAAAMATRVNNVTLARICRGEVSPSVATLERIFDAIGWDVVVAFRPRKNRAKRRTKRASS